MKKLKVLVVDNSPVVLKILSVILEQEGCEVCTADNGLQALEMVPQLEPDIIFTDLIMPKIDGAKLCRVIRSTSRYRHIFLVVLSGVALEDGVNVQELEADVCIAKGPASVMRRYILDALAQYRRGERYDCTVKGLDGLHVREVTRELLTAKRHNDIILDRMSEGVVELDGSGRVLMANRAMLQILGQPEVRLLASRLPEYLLGEEGRQIESWLESLEKGVLEPLVFDGEDPLHIRDRLVTVNLVPLVEDDHIFIVGIFRDITRRKQAQERQKLLERELQRIRKLDAMSMMASGISHDFNNLLAIIKGNVEMALLCCRERPKMLELLKEADRALQHTTDLIRQFTTFSDNYLPSRSQVDIRDLIADVLEHAVKGTEVRTVLEASDGLEPVDVDPSQIILVLSNILQNALEAVGHDGEITIRIDGVDGAREGEKTGLLFRPGPYIHVAVIDNGPGIDPELLDRVFDPYFSTKQKGIQKGMGLGLTIVHAIVKKHGGVVRIESEAGRGCTVHLYFPLAFAPEQDQACSSDDISIRALIMDDDEMIRIVSSKMFSLLGCSVELAENGEQAVRLYEQAMEENRPFQLVVLDLRVSGGMGGREAAGKIHRLDPNANMIAASGDSADQVILNPGAYHFKGTLVKPYSIDMVKDIIRQVERSMA
ncbi:ATP-binding response regulator [Desulfolithobacter sp.]